MSDKINQSTIDNGSINGISKDSFDKLSPEQKDIVLSGNNASRDKDKDGGWLGRFLGVNPRNASMHIAFIICGILLLFCAVDLLFSLYLKNGITSQVWELIFPVITLSLGYIFGKGDHK
ncbi:MAG TPA: hypothetical protein IAA05_05765 [Candidatus Blautia excrementipullorum]|nr:hypothetical protein [Candidatus Blautia excrementipullorum]